MGFQAGVGQVVLAGGDHEHIGGGIEQAQAEVVVQGAAVVDGEAEIGRLAAQALQRFQLQNSSLAGIGVATHGAEQIRGWSTGRPRSPGPGPDHRVPKRSG